MPGHNPTSSYPISGYRIRKTNPFDLRRRQIIQRVDVAEGLIHQLEVQVRAGGGAAGHADQAKDIALAHVLPAAHVDLAHVGVEGLPAVAMVDDDKITITPSI